MNHTNVRIIVNRLAHVVFFEQLPWTRNRDLTLVLQGG